MTATSVDPMQHVRVSLARVQQRIGWAGVAGVALFAAGAVVIALAWSVQAAFVRSDEARAVAMVAGAPSPSASAAAAAPAIPELSPASEIPLLLTQIKQAAVGNGLDWRAAEYRVTAATPTQPASLEVRCSIRGPYPKLRSMLVQLKDSIPAFSLREFGASRPNADTADVDAKLALAVFLQDGAAASEAAVKGPP